MKNIPKILLKTYLRRQPVHLRLQRFNIFARYSWLKNVLEDLRPELFPPEEPEPPEEGALEVPEVDAVVAQLIDAQVRGRRGIYQVERWLGKRGQGHLFAALKLGEKQPVILKEFLLPSRIFSLTEAQQRQRQFVNLAGLSRTDGRSQDLRIIQTLDAIADTQSVERCYLITDVRDAAPTLRQQLQAEGAFLPSDVRRVLEQVLQTLLHLHQQIFALPLGQRQRGLVHGNLTLDSLLWIETPPNDGFVYLTDLALWEQIFAPPAAEPYMANVTPGKVSQDLIAVGTIGVALLTGSETLPEPTDNPADWDLPAADPDLATFIKRLSTPYTFDSAEAAWQELLRLPAPTPQEAISTTVDTTAESQRRVPRWLIALASALALVLLGGFLWRLLLRSQAPASQAAPVCCFEEVGAVPAGEYVYTAVDEGTWAYVLSQRNLGQRGQSFEAALEADQPELSLMYQPAASVDDAIAAVQAGQAEFAIMPRFPDLELPAELGAATIAHDGLAVFVAFGYAERERSLPRALGGELSLAELNDLYLGQIETWREISRAWLPIKRYIPENPEAVQLFENDGLVGLDLGRLSEVEPLPTFPMFRAILQDFENQQVGSVGFAPLSQVFGQCSIYPLALAAETGPAVQPLILNTGDEVTPNIDLCDRKGAYFPNIEALQTGEYPLAYEIIVVFPQDNSRVPVGQKFVELLRTAEGQQLLREAGLTPFHGLTPQ